MRGRSGRASGRAAGVAGAIVGVAALVALHGCGPQPAHGPAQRPAPQPAPEQATQPAPQRPTPSGVGWAERFRDADSVRVAGVGAGVEHAYLWLGQGPWAVHVLAIDRDVCGPVVAARKAGPPLDARAPTSALAAGGVAGINADFFMIPGGTPVGAAVHGGRVLAGPSTRPAFGIGAAGDPVAGVARLDGWIAVPGDTAVIARVNRTGSDRHHPERAGIVVLDEWYGAPAPDTGVTVRVRRVVTAPSGDAGPERGVVTGDGTGAVVLRGVGPGAAAWLARRVPGDTVGWEIQVVMDRADAGPAPGAGVARAPGSGVTGTTGSDRGGAVRLLEAVGGFPLLVVDGTGVYAEQTGVSESFGDARHPRTAIGWDDEGRWFWVVVDGRQLPYSDGMTLAELEGLFLALGATHAINLDGGGSSAMVVRGRLANRPSDAAGERPVGNALVLDRCTGSGR